MKFFYPDTLPVVARKDEISKAVAENRVVIVAGDTGSGKTTQIPKICLETLPESPLLIGCTQPRRIAATSVSARVAEELGEMGRSVGYKIRFHDHTTPETKIKFMTDGVLLAETRQDPLLTRYRVILLDEAHERSLNIDFLLGYLKKILPERPDLKIIITSATIDTAAFSRHFDDAPVVAVSGRTYPVEVCYRPPAGDDSFDSDGYVEHCAQSILHILSAEPPGDILAFLPTEKDIRACCGLVEKKAGDAVVLPMFGRLQAADQKRIFQHHRNTKIVIATNVAETSITVPGIRYVVDSGLARMAFYNARAKTTSLPIHRISRASCDQRKGRCGRIGPGICFRLYSEEDYLGRDAYTLPEIKRANLAEVILQMTSLSLGRPDDFPFIDPPHRNAIRDGYKLLFELGAISSQNALTATGRFMARLPIDPCISRILLEAKSENCLAEVKIIASALAIQDPRIRPAEREKEADAIHKEFAHPHSDFMALLNIWNHFHNVQGKTRSWSKLKKYCKAHYLSFQRMREWLDLHEQLARLLEREEGFSDNAGEAAYQQIHKALAAGFLRNIAVKKQAKIYQGAGNRELMIFPGSHQFLTGGGWIVAASFLETNRLYGLTVATIEPEWLEHLAPHLCRYSWSDPRWNKKSGQVIAEEKVALFGLIIASGRKVNFPKRSEKNVAEARNIFIQAALVEGNLQGNYPFLTHNLQKIDHWREAEDKLRTTAVVRDDTELASFYAQRLPDWVCDRATLNRHLKKRGHTFLQMSDDDVLHSRPDENALADFPPTLTVGSMELQLQYDFSPGSETDGVTIRIPLSLAPVLSATTFEWLVPGLLQEKVMFLIKGLPKRLRKHLVPVNLTVDRLLDDLRPYQGSLYHALESSIMKMFKIGVRRSDWPQELPGHLRARFVLFDLEGREVDYGRDLGKLLERTRSEQSAPPAKRAEVAGESKREMARWKDVTTRDWAFDGLPQNIPLLTPTGDVGGFLYPVLIPIPDQGEVLVSFVQSQEEAKRKNLRGVEYLYRLQFANGYRALKKYCLSQLSGPSALLFFQTGVARKAAVDQLLGCVMRAVFPGIDGTIPTRETFQRQVAEARQADLYRKGQYLADEAMNVLRKRKEVLEKLQHYITLDKRGLVFNKESREEFSSLVAAIVPAEFLETATATQLEWSLRQLQSLAMRIERFYANPDKDREKMRLLAPHLESLEQLSKRRNELSGEAMELLQQYNLMIGEFRISLFSPEIRTRISVSSKKLQRQRQALLAKC